VNTSPALLVYFTLARLVIMLGFRNVFVWALTWWLRGGVSRRTGVKKLIGEEREGLKLAPERVHYIDHPTGDLLSEHWFPGILDLWYLGCFRDTRARMFTRCLEGKHHTADACTQEALKRSVTHIGRQSRGECWCGISADMTSAYEVRDDEDCGLPETGRGGGTREGGHWANAVYHFNLPTHSVMKESSVELWYLGCFRSRPNTLEGKIFSTICLPGFDVPTDDCAKKAAEQSMTHIGHEAGMCYCGLLTEMTSREDYPPHKRPDSECGEENDDGVRPGFGGGSDSASRNAVYEFQLPPTTAT